MIAQIGDDIRLVPFEEVVGGIRGVEVQGDTVATGRDLGICFGDEAPSAFADREAAVVS
jgi:6-phosphofructokinase 1